MDGGTKLDLLYTDGAGQMTGRVIWPIDLTLAPPVLLLAAWCELRADFRTFRPDRIRAATLIDTPHNRPPAELRAGYAASRASPRPPRPLLTAPLAPVVKVRPRPQSAPPEPAYRPDWAGLARRLSGVADNLDAGHRETPQRFNPLAHYAHVNGQAVALLRWLFADALAEAATDPACAFATRALLAAMLAYLDAPVSGWHGRMIGGLGPLIRAAAPRVRRRRHIHCHGWITTDRRLLLLDIMLGPDDKGMPGLTENRPCPLWLWHAIAYAMVDYDHDHFVMLGAPTAARIRRLSGWVRGLGETDEAQGGARF